MHEAGDAGQSPLKLRLFGRFEGQRGDHRLPPTRTRKEVWLLCLLILRGGQAVERRWLAGVLWPDSEEERALANLRRSLNNLREVLGAEAYRIDAPTPRALRLDLQGAQVDVIAFDAAISRRDLISLHQAVDIYRNSLLEDCTEEWIYPERRQREQAYLMALDTLASDALAQREWAEATRYARLLIAADPLQETAHRTLMQALAQSGNHAAATQAYRDLRLRLREGWNAEPEAATHTLYERIRQEARQQPAVAGREGMAERLSPPMSASALPPLPRPITRLIGRKEALSDVLALLRTSRLLTLTGTGGVGKTTLALEIAHSAAADYADGVAFADLSYLTDPNLVLQTLAGACNIKEAAGVALKTTLLTALQTQCLLMVVDNCEHLLGAVAQGLHSLLQSCPGLSVLATSRQSLGLPGEVLWRVPSLSTPPVLPATAGNKRAKQDSSELLEYPAVQLFVERVRQTNPEFRLTPANLPAIARICQRLDGIPLALELAAGRVRALSVEQIAEKLQHRFQLLTGGNRAALPRQQTLRALIDWSYTLLEEGEKLLLARLSVFSGGWTLEAAESVCAGEGLEDWEVLDLLASLVDKSLAVKEEQSGTVRYRMLETIRQYSQEQLEQEATARIETMQRMRDYFTSFVEELYNRQFKADGAHWMAQAKLEIDNLRAVLDYCTQDASSLPQGLQIAGMLRLFWQIRGFVSEGRQRLERLFEADQLKQPSRQRFDAVSAACNLARAQGDFASARRYIQEELEIAQALDDQDRISVALGHMASLHYQLGELDRAMDYYQQELVILEKRGNQRNMAANFHNQGLVLADQRNFTEAFHQTERALALNRLLGNRHWELYNLLSLGICATELQDMVGANTYLNQALALSQELEDRYSMAQALDCLGCAALRQGKAAEAVALYLQSLPIVLENGDRQTLAILLLNMTDAALYQEKWDYSVLTFTAAGLVFEEMGGIHLKRTQATHAALHERLCAHLGMEVLRRAQDQVRSLTPDERMTRILKEVGEQDLSPGRNI